MSVTSSAAYTLVRLVLSCITEADIQPTIGHGKQESQRSWWPKQSTWLASSRYIGYWNESCEEWYRNHLKKILNGTAKPKTATEWRQELRRGAHNTPKVYKNYEAAAARFLST
jgi:hypothetical protein